MSPESPESYEGLDDKIQGIIGILIRNLELLERLTGGEVDTFLDQNGQVFNLRGVQQQIRLSDAIRHTATLDALPANIALLDSSGKIISVNESWRQFGRANDLLSPGYGLGLDYLEICDQTNGSGTFESRRAAKGIRTVLEGTADRFSIVYPCHAPTHQRWFMMIVTPVGKGHPGGAVIMHLNVTSVHKSRKKLRVSETRFRQMAENIKDVFFLRDADGSRMLYVSPAYEQIWGRSCASLYTNPESWLESIHPEDREITAEKSRLGLLTGEFDLEYRIIRPDASVRWIETRGFPVRNADGKVVRIAGVAKDISEARVAEAKILQFTNINTALSQCNKAIVHCASEEELFLKICHIAVHYGGMKMAWVGIIDPATLMVTPVASYGDDTGYLKTVNISVAQDDPTGSGPSGIAIREDRPYWCQDLMHDSVTLIWRDYAVRAGIFASAALPLHRKGKVVGTFTLYAGEVEYFKEPVRDLLVELASEISFALDNLDHEVSRKQAETRIKYLNRVYAMLSGINSLIVRAHDRNELYKEACRIAVETGGFCMSLIGIVNQLTQMIVPVASAGKDDDLLMAVKQLVSSREIYSTTMVARAVREKIAIVSNDSQNDAQVLLGDKYAEAGIHSMVILPLLVADEAIGALALYSSEPEFFHKEELELLRELAGDIAFAIYHIDNQDRLKYLSYYDVLTGLANRNLFLERVAQYIHTAIGGGHKLALCLMDMERFRNINDSLGRTTGDDLLKQVAQWLIKNTGGDPAGLARIDADHFALVVPVLNPQDNLSHVLEKIMKALVDHPFRVHETVLRITVKMGVAIFPDDGGNTDILYRNAEVALKNAKLSGARYLFYRQKMTEAVAGNLTLENQLRRALDQGEFVLHYQPKMNLVTGKLAGAEALIRWNDPQTGLVPPGRFIPILEQTGLIYEVGRWALYKAINDYLHWRNTGKPAVRISVNVSSLQLRNPGFLAEIRQAIDVDPEAKTGLELEITESLIMEDITNTISSLKSIREMGIGLAIDDFGTGFSSLSYLSRLPVDILKIDRSFVIDMTTGPEGLALVSTIINLAHSLKLKVVAEGVETEEQSRLLRLLNCDEIQGFLISKPLPIDVFESRFLAVVSA